MRSILIVLLLTAPACSQEFFALGEALCWRPWSGDFTNAFDSSLSVNRGWEAGARGGLGIQHPVGLKGSWTYTWFAAEDTTSTARRDEVGGAMSYGDLDYQVHDFDLARVIYLTQYCQFEPFVGFRWGRIDYSLRDLDGSSALSMNSNTDSYGVRLGSNGRLSLTEQLSLFGQGAFSGLLSTTENTGLDSDGTWDATDDHENHGADAAAGVAWECGLLEVAAGYEWNWWANVVQRRNSTSQPDYDDLLLEGVFLRVTGRY